MFPPETKVLIVDDLKTIRSILAEILNRAGITNIDQCGDGLQALKMLEAAAESPEPYGLIICDWNMPELTGIELLNKKIENPKLSSIPFLMITIESEREYVLKAIAMGVDDFVVKPFNEQTVIKKLTNVWNRLHQ